MHSLNPSHIDTCTFVSTDQRSRVEIGNAPPGSDPKQGLQPAPDWQALAAHGQGGVMAAAGHAIADEQPTALLQRRAEVFADVEAWETRP